MLSEICAGTGMQEIGKGTTEETSSVTNGADVTFCSGRVFRQAATGKARSPMVERQ